ncbi:hypothetical protein CSC70_04005 [Pseudoxanthomonas kalamensis DSM 18571]|uniref:hypothetical protein n=1 Tax=Pseudoxanthomonas kalamensis TaxID=289483 RepID=UPI0013919204|nr:hypothetical protein [Pseudoxanthomonas kalamensis]KAF1711100.1 hypothetical protein CSC70_04005 [Pseudoxanthomonas kalamensis DSM 18571]
MSEQMEYRVTLTKSVTVMADDALSAIRAAEKVVRGAKAVSVYCDESGEQRYVIERCEGCDKPRLDGDNSGAHWEDGVWTCGDCTALEPGERVAGRPSLRVVGNAAPEPGVG